MFPEPSPDIHVSVSDAIRVALDGGVRLDRTYTFSTNLRTPRPLRYFQREPAGVALVPRGRLDPELGGELRFYTQQLEDPLHRFLWEIEGELTFDRPLKATLELDLQLANCDSPLEYSVYFESVDRVAYDLRLNPPLPSCTSADRFSFTGTPPLLLDNLQRADSGALVTSGAVDVAENLSGPIALHFRHHIELESTRLMRYYATELRDQ